MVEFIFPASCGEIVQGRIDSQEFLLNYAINCYTRLTFTPASSSPRNLTSKLIQAKKVFQNHHPDLKIPWQQLNWHYQTSIPVGKGLGSSTADLATFLWGLNWKYNQTRLDEQTLFSWLTEIEPTDSIVYRPLTVCHPLTGEIYHQVDHWLEMDILCLWPRLSYSTNHYRNANYYQWTDQEKDTYRELLEETKRALDSREVDYLAKCARQSAQLNDRLVPKPYLNRLLTWVQQQTETLGLNISHSGTALAIWLQPNAYSRQEVIQQLKALGVLDYYQHQLWSQTMPGGIRLLEGKE